MIIPYEIEQEIKLLEKLVEQKPNAADWISERINLLSRIYRDFKEMHEVLSNDLKMISNLERDIAVLNMENIELGRALAVAKKTLEGITT